MDRFESCLQFLMFLWEVFSIGGKFFLVWIAFKVVCSFYWF